MGNNKDDLTPQCLDDCTDTNVKRNARAVCLCVSVHTNLVDTASRGKWRLLNTKAKAPS